MQENVRESITTSAGAERCDEFTGGERRSPYRSGLGWIVLSPLAAFLAAISSVESLTVYYVQLAVFGAWTMGGIVCGAGWIVSARWTVRLEAWLLTTAIAYVGGMGALFVVFTLAALHEPLAPDVILPLMVGLGGGATVIAAALPWLRRRRHAAANLRGGPAEHR